MAFSIEQPRDGVKDETKVPTSGPTNVNQDNAFADREAFEQWKANRDTTETVEEKPEPKRYTDVGALARDLDLLLSQHGWTWPDRDEDDNTTDASNR